MAFADNLPLNESLGVFVGIAGMDWLTDGYAEPLKAAIVAIAAGAVIFTVRRLLSKRRRQ